MRNGIAELNERRVAQGKAPIGIGIIPETRTATTLGAAQVGTVVNLEVDVMAKYAERLLAAGNFGTGGPA